MGEKIAAVEAKYAPKEEPKKEIEGLAQINIEDFAKVELRAAKVVACEPIKRAKKLLKLHAAVKELEAHARRRNLHTPHGRVRHREVV